MKKLVHYCCQIKLLLVECEISSESLSVNNDAMYDVVYLGTYDFRHFCTTHVC